MSSKNMKKSIVVAVQKATPSNFKNAKEKHVRKICLQTFAKDPTADEILIGALSKRLDKDNWAVRQPLCGVFVTNLHPTCARICIELYPIISILWR